MYLVHSSYTLNLWLYEDTTTKKSIKPKEAIQIIPFMLFSTKRPWRTTAMLQIVRHKAPKQRSYTSIPSDVTWVKWPTDLSVQRRWKALIQHAGITKRQRMSTR